MHFLHLAAPISDSRDMECTLYGFHQDAPSFEPHGGDSQINRAYYVGECLVAGLAIVLDSAVDDSIAVGAPMRP